MKHQSISSYLMLVGSLGLASAGAQAASSTPKTSVEDLTLINEKGSVEKLASADYHHHHHYYGHHHHHYYGHHHHHYYGHHYHHYYGHHHHHYYGHHHHHYYQTTMNTSVKVDPISSPKVSLTQ